MVATKKDEDVRSRESDITKNFTLKTLSAIFQETTKRKMQTDPSFASSRTICHILEKNLALYRMMRRGRQALFRLLLVSFFTKKNILILNVSNAFALQCTK